MSKTSYGLLALMVAALIMMGAVRAREWYMQYKTAQEIASENDGTPFTFQQVPVSLAAPEAEAVPNPVRYKRGYPEVYLEDTPLAPQEQAQQAQDTIASIIEDYKDEPSLAQFNADLQQASHGEVKDLVDLSTQNLQQILQQNPEIAHVVEKHAKEVDFTKVLEEIFNNPQFQQSVKELQGKNSHMQKHPAQ